MPGEHPFFVQRIWGNGHGMARVEVTPGMVVFVRGAERRVLSVGAEYCVVTSSLTPGVPGQVAICRRGEVL